MGAHKLIRKSGRELILANLSHEHPERPGITFDRGRINDMALVWACESEGYAQKRWTEGEVEYYDDRWGNIWKRMKTGPIKGEIHLPILPDWEGMKDFRAPRYDIDKTADHFRAGFAAEAVKSPDEKYRVAGIGGWIFDNARYLRKLEVYLLDLALYPDELRIVHERVAVMYESLILAAAKAGADAIHIGEDMGTQTGLLFSPDMFRSYFKPLYTRLMGMAHEKGMKVLLHSCGQNRAILDDLMDCGVDVFQFDQPTVYDMADLSELFRRRGASLWSPVDIQKILPTGNRDYIREETFKMCRIFDGCLIVKNYPDLPGIGVAEEWDEWGYQAVLEYCGLDYPQNKLEK
jgi:uroporphyrinogen decarboxylase